MPSFMIGDILEYQKRQSGNDLGRPKQLDQEEEEEIDFSTTSAPSPWTIFSSSKKAPSPIDLCTRLPFTFPPFCGHWLGGNQNPFDSSFSRQPSFHRDSDTQFTPHNLSTDTERSPFCQPSSSSSSSQQQQQQQQQAPHLNSTKDSATTASKKARKARTAFSDHQLNELERTFERQKYLSVQDRMQLAEKLHLSDMQVKTWYQNRRTKWKRQATIGLELLSESASRGILAESSSCSPGVGRGCWTSTSNTSTRSPLVSPGQAQTTLAHPPDLLTLLASSTNRDAIGGLGPSATPSLDLLKCLVQQQHGGSVVGGGGSTNVGGGELLNTKAFEMFSSRYTPVI